jgi:hypothetical protein
VPTGEIGTPHPLLLQAAASDAGWVAMCQARADTDGDGSVTVAVGRHGDTSGDALQTYFVQGSGPGVPIDALVAVDPTGRYVVVSRGRDLVLLDTARNKEQVLAGGLTVDDPNPLGSHRAASFDGAGRRLAYFRLRGGKEQVVVHDLADGNEQVVTPVPGALWRAQLDPGGEVLWLWVLDRDTDGDGVIGQPQAKTTLAKRGCRGPVSVFGRYGWRGDKPTQWTARRDDGWTAREDATAIGAMGSAIVRRRPDGALVRESGGAEREIVAASCGGRVVHADAASDTLHVVCAARGKPDSSSFVRAPLERYQGGTRKALDVETQIKTHDSDEFHRADPLLTIYGADENTHRVLNVATGTIGKIPLGAPDATSGDSVLLRPYPYKTGHFFIDLRTGAREAVPAKLGYWGREREGDLLAIGAEDGGGIVIDLASRRILGRVPGTPLALARSGHVLLSPTDTGARPALNNIPRGPLKWVAPSGDR